MFNLTLKTDITTFDNQTLLQSGTGLTIDILEHLISSNKVKMYNIYPLLHYESIQKDLVFCISQHTYQGIFSIGEKFRGLLECMKNVYLAEPVLQSLVSLKTYDLYTYRHNLIVFALSSLLATYLIEDFYDRVREATSSPSHDIGKICTPVNILQKADPLTKTEMDILNQHTIAGYVLISYYCHNVNHLSAIIARDHHEKKDGSGHPRGIRLSDPMVEIVVVCDIYDALISARPYRPMSFDNRTALEELTIMAENNEVNSDIVKILVALNRKDKPVYSECIVSKERRGTPPEYNNYGIIDESEGNPEDTRSD